MKSGSKVIISKNKAREWWMHRVRQSCLTAFSRSSNRSTWNTLNKRQEARWRLAFKVIILSLALSTKEASKITVPQLLISHLCHRLNLATLSQIKFRSQSSLRSSNSLLHHRYNNLFSNFRRRFLHRCLVRWQLRAAIIIFHQQPIITPLNSTSVKSSH